MDEESRRRRTTRLEAALWIVLGVLAFLAKDNPDLVYPQALYLFLGLLASSLGTSLAVRLAPRTDWLHALGLTAGFASVAALQEWSGGPASILWALYLLPLFTAAILLDGRAVAWTAAGACVCNAALYAAAPGPWSPGATFELALKSAVLAGAAGAAWLLARSEREAGARARRQRAVIERLEREIRAETETRERERELTSIAAGGAGAAHDLATPLMVVRGYARIHLDKGVDDPELARDLKRIDDAAAFCQNLASGLLSRAGGPASARRLDAAVETALALAEPILRSRRVSVEREYPLEDLSVMAAPQAIERVALNLVGNAAKAMPSGGRVRVSLARESRDGRDWALLTVDDEGPGLAPEIMARLFQPFATTRAGRGGTGLGLFASRETARRHGGDLTAENRAGGGARFVVRLPAVASTAGSPA